MRVQGMSCGALVAALLATLAVPGANATLAPDAAKVLDRYVAAIGGRAALEAERSVHSRNTISAFGFNGTLESWSQKPDKMASQTALGPFTLKDGFDGTTAWRVDQNGKLSIRDGKDLENEKGNAWFENGQWLTADQGGGSVTVQGQEKDSTGAAWTVLEIKPPIGRSHACWFNNKSGLLERVVTKTDAQVVITRLLDYRVDAGVNRPHKQETSIEGMARNNISSTLDSLWVNETIDPARFAPPAAMASDVTFLKGNGVAKIPMRYGEKHVWLKVSVDGRPAEDFILDTGASVSLLDSAWAASHGIASEGKMQAVGAGASGDVAFAKVGGIQVAGPDGDGVKIGGQKLAVLALNRYIAPFFWRDAAGILGYDFISRFVIAIDYDQQTLTLYDPKTFQYAGKGTGVPITLAGSIPVVKAKLDGQYDGEFRLDVGSGSTLDIHGPYVKKNGLSAKIGKTIEIVNGGFGGTFTSACGRMKSMEIGPYSWKDPLVILSGARTGGLASEDYAGNIGNEVFERFRCTFDYEHRMLYLEPGPKYGKPDRFSRAGVQLAKFDDQIKAMQVLPGSAAAAGGIKEGDVVTKLDGKPIASWTQDAITTMFETGAVGEKHTFEILRDGKKRTITIKLKEMI